MTEVSVEIGGLRQKFYEQASGCPTMEWVIGGYVEGQSERLDFLVRVGSIERLVDSCQRCLDAEVDSKEDIEDSLRCAFTGRVASFVVGVDLYAPKTQEAANNRIQFARMLRAESDLDSDEPSTS